MLMLLLVEMDMDGIERMDWAYNVEGLRIRVRSLGTKEKIDRAIRMWKEGQGSGRRRKSPSASLQQGSVISPGDNSIEARDTRQLLKFKNLRVLAWMEDSKAA
jgi:hypothetical protein